MLWLYKAVSACPCCSSHWSLMFNLESVNIMNYSESKCSTQKFVLSKRLSCNVFVDSCIAYIERNHCLANLHRGNQCCSSSCCSRLLRAYGSTHGDVHRFWVNQMDHKIQRFVKLNGSKHTKPHMTGATPQTCQIVSVSYLFGHLSASSFFVTFWQARSWFQFSEFCKGMCKIHLVGLMNQPGFHNLIKFGWFSPKNTG